MGTGEERVISETYPSPEVQACPGGVHRIDLGRHRSLLVGHKAGLYEGHKSVDDDGTSSRQKWGASTRTLVRIVHGRTDVGGRRPLLRCGGSNDTLRLQDEGENLIEH